MKSALTRAISAVLSVLMLVSMMSCLFGITASAAEVTKDSGNMPSHLFDTAYWDETAEGIYNDYSKIMSDGSTRFTRRVRGEFGSALLNETIEFDVKSNSDWSINLREDAEYSDGYKIGVCGKTIYIARKVDGKSYTSVSPGGANGIYDTINWHRFKIKFEDTATYTSIEVTVDGRVIPFMDANTYHYSELVPMDKTINDRKTLNGKFYDFNPIQTATNIYCELDPEKPDGNIIINRKGAMAIRSIDADLTNAVDPYRITFMGDSITQGALVQHNETWVHVTNGILGNTFDCYNAGVSTGAAYTGTGYGTSYKGQNQFTYAQYNQADLVVMMLGTNDSKYIRDNTTLEMFTGERLEGWHEKFITDYSALLDAVNFEGTKLVLVLPPWNYYSTEWTDETIRKKGEWIKEIAAKYDNAVVFDMYSVTKDHEDWFVDKLHPNPTGHQYMGEAFAEWLVNESGIDLTKTAARTVSVSPTIDTNFQAAHSSVLNSYSGTFNKNNFSGVSTAYITMADNECWFLDGGVGAMMGATSNDRYNLGTSWSVTYQFKQSTGYSIKLDPTAGFDWYDGAYRYSSMIIGNMEIRMYHITDQNTSTIFSAYRLFMNNVEIAEPAISTSFLADATYSVDYSFGSIKIIRTNDNFTIFNLNGTKMQELVGKDYRFDNIRLATYMYETGGKCYWNKLVIESRDLVEGKYDISSTENGHIEVNGAVFDSTSTFYVGENIVLKAVCDTEGYMFTKWVDGNGNKLSTDAEYVFNVTAEEKVVKAVFEEYYPYAFVTLTAKTGGKVFIDGAAYDYNKDYAVGTEVTLSASANSGYEFGYWLDSLGNVVSDKSVFTVKLARYTDYTAVFFTAAKNNATIVFVGRGGAIAGTQTVAVGTELTLPEMPKVYGYTPLHWDVNGQAMKVGDSLTVNQNLVIKAVNTKDAAQYVVSVEGGTVSGRQSYGFAYNTRVTVIFDNALLGAGEVFYGWHNADSTNENSIISFDQAYSFYVGADVNLVAVIANTYADVKPVTDVTNVNLIENGTKATFLTERTVPTGYTVVKSGVIYTADKTKADSLTIDNIGGTVFTKTAASTSANGQLRLTLSSKDGSAITVYVVSYLTYLDKSGNEYTIYSDVFSAKTSVAEIEESTDSL